MKAIDRRKVLQAGTGAAWLAGSVGLARAEESKTGANLGLDLEGGSYTILEVDGIQIPFGGRADDQFSACQKAFWDNFIEGKDVGASFAVIKDGETVVDLWGGHADAARTQPWQQDTIVNTYSTTKTMTALCALVLADRGELSFDDPVSKYWPEFSANGKSDVRVSHFMSHSAGLPVWDEEVSYEDLYDWDKMTGLLAAQAPWWEPGTASGYHALTQGYLTGEVVRRITGQTLGTFFKEQIADPLEAEFYIGTPETADDRVAPLLLWTGDVPSRDFGPHGAKVFSNPSRVPQGRELSDSVDWRRAEIPAANGHGSALGIARAQSVMAQGGEANGKRILSEEGARVALQEQIAGDDLVLGVYLRHGMGYGLQIGPQPMPNEEVIFWSGRGGSRVIVDMKNRLTIAYAMNQMMPQSLGVLRTAPLIQAVYKSLA